ALLLGVVALVHRIVAGHGAGVAKGRIETCDFAGFLREIAAVVEVQGENAHAGLEAARARDVIGDGLELTRVRIEIDGAIVVAGSGRLQAGAVCAVDVDFRSRSRAARVAGQGPQTAVCNVVATGLGYVGDRHRSRGGRVRQRDLDADLGFGQYLRHGDGCAQQQGQQAGGD